MRISGRQISIEVPSISQEKIIDFLSQTKFHKTDIEEVMSTSFFRKFREMYNGIPVLSKYTSNDREKLTQCFEWLEYDIQIDGISVEAYEFDANDPWKHTYKSYKINSIIFTLLHNDSLKTILNVNVDGEEIGFTDIEEQYKEISNFEKIEFTEISPYTLDGELAEIALQGSVYNEWKESAITTKQMTTEFVNKITEGRFNDFKIYRTTECWSGYFLGFFIAYFIFDCKKGELWVLSKDDWD
jgi:hypothetical protein